MATINITVPSDGTTIDASDVATPLNTIVSEINGSLDSNNIASGGVVPNNLTAGTGTSWAWQSWTPSWGANLTTGNGTVTAKYIQVGKMVVCRIDFVLGSTSSISGNVTFSLPVTAASYTALHHCGTVRYQDDTGADGVGRIAINSTTSAYLTVLRADTTYVTDADLSSTVPFTWATNDAIRGTFVYEAA